MPKFKEDVPLRRLSNYKIGGPARFFFSPKNEREVGWAVREAKKRKLPILILGGGTNLLINDRGFPGLVLKSAIRVLRARRIARAARVVRAGRRNLAPAGPAEYRVAVGAGVLMSDLLDFCVKHSLSGLEWAGGLPGTVGGAIRGNAGCFGGEMKDVVESVRSFDARAMKPLLRNARACGFGYRASIFKKKNGREIILEAALRLRKGGKKAIADSIREKIAYRERNHPLDYPNIGSIFKNVPLAALRRGRGRGGLGKQGAAYREALRAARIVYRGSHFSVKNDPFPVVSAAKLVAETGLRGVSAGGAMISGRHPNFIVNALDAQASDVKALMGLAKAAVKKRFSVELEEEVQIV